MHYRNVILIGICLLGSSLCVAQSAQYTRKLSGTLDISNQGRVSMYDLQTAGVPAIDQDLGSLVESWQFQLPTNSLGAKALKADFVITVVRKSLTEEDFIVKRVEFFPLKVSPKARRPQSADELAYCSQENAVARADIICSAVLPTDPDLAVSAEVYVAIKKVDGEPQFSIESLNLYSKQNTKLLSKNMRVAKVKYSEAALAWAKKNSQGFLQDKDLFLTRVEYVQVPNTLLWRRQENIADVPAIWVNDDFREKTKYVGQAGLEVILK
jgi:hypothetical protein